MKITLLSPDGNPVKALGQLTYLKDGNLQAFSTETDARGILAFPDVVGAKDLFVIFYAGFWTLRFDAANVPATFTCPPLPPAGGSMWWHRALGLTNPDPSAGLGIRIGIVDGDFGVGAGLQHISFMDIAGNKVTPRRTTSPQHGEQVCRLIGQRGSNANEFGGIAPGAEVFCIDAQVNGRINPAIVASAIVRLARDFECDLINLSMGKFVPLPGLEQAIIEARQLGTLCLVAAGNESVDAVAFPAQYEQCVGVGAVGRQGWGPAGTLVQDFSRVARRNPALLGKVAGLDIFHYPRSAYGTGLNLVAPGVGIVIDQGGASKIDVCGTSFAAPLATGTLAVLLERSADDYRGIARGPNRTAYAEQRLKDACIATGIERDREGWGFPRLS